MNYSVLIQNRKSVREFTDREISFSTLAKIGDYYQNAVRRLVPDIQTELQFFGSAAQGALEGAAGYHQFLVGAPQYLVLLSEQADQALENGGFIMEDMILKLTDLGLDSCWLTFTDSEEIKGSLGIASPMDVVAIVAFGYGVKTTKRLRLNIRSMSNVDVVAKHRYVEPKRSVYDMVFLNKWGNIHGLDTHIGFFDDMLWEAFYAASLSPSYLNRQAYGFVIHDEGISLVSRPDAYNTEIDGKLSLGIVLHHFSSVAEHWAGKFRWDFGPVALDLPEGHKVVATCRL